MIGNEVDFEPPHGLEVFDVTYDGVTLSFLTETGRSVTMYGSMRFFNVRMSDDEDIPDQTSGIFGGDYEADDFIYPVEVHFTDTHGYIFERPRLLPECMIPIDVHPSHARFQDAHSCEFVCIRDPKAAWLPEKGEVVGRVGHLLFIM